jgi:ABC-type multidrug transport system fused ATPase/permease subunit
LPAPRGFRRLTVDDVGFAYPGTARPALDGVSLEIGEGEVIALVGENGSGKTTLAKIVAGLYPPQRGRVLWDGVDGGRHDPDELRRSVAVIFQDFERYLLPARENVGLGRHERIDDLDAIVAAARRADADGFLRMRELLHGRSVVLISHRFSSVRSADRIYVVHRGRVVEHGTHEELMVEAGLYAELFTLQARAYLGR